MFTLDFYSCQLKMNLYIAQSFTDSPNDVAYSYTYMCSKTENQTKMEAKR